MHVFDHAEVKQRPFGDVVDDPGDGLERVFQFHIYAGPAGEPVELASPADDQPVFFAKFVDAEDGGDFRQVDTARARSVTSAAVNIPLVWQQTHKLVLTRRLAVTTGLIAGKLFWRWQTPQSGDSTAVRDPTVGVPAIPGG